VAHRVGERRSRPLLLLLLLPPLLLLFPLLTFRKALE
jgi:hypothetical protein